MTSRQPNLRDPLRVPTRLCSFGVATLLFAWPAVAQLPEPEYDETVELISLVQEAADLVEEQGLEFACGEFRQSGTKWFQDEIYVFVYDMAGKSLCHPVRPNLEGRALLELRDPFGRPIVETFVRELEGESETAWVHYLWPKPGSQTFTWKTSHIRRARDGDRDLIVGSGLYQMQMERFFVVEQVNDAVDLMRESGESAFYTMRDRSTSFRFYDAYVFVLDPDGLMLVNVGFPDLEGTNVALLQDSTGKAFVQEMLAVGDDSPAWVDYMWPKPGDSRPAKKSSYLRRVTIDGQEYIVGAGVYFR
jgi:signal transduction histidine kinase